MDPRTNPQQYGPQGMPPQPAPVNMDVGQGIQEALDSADPEMLHLANSIGSVVKRRGNQDLLIKGAFTGETPDDLRNYAAAENAAKEAMRMAQESLSLSDSKFNQLLEQINQPDTSEPPQPEALQAPSNDMLVAAGLGAILSPRHGFDILSTPFREQIRRRDEKFALARDKYQIEQGKRQERLRSLTMQLDLWERHRAQALGEINRLGEEAWRRGEKQRSEQLGWYGQFLGADTEGDIDKAVSMLEGSPYKPSPSQISGRKQQIRDAQTLKDDLAKQKADKDKFDAESKIVDDVMAPLKARINAGGGLTKEEADQLEKDIQAAAKANGIPRERFGPPIRAFEGLGMRREARDQERWNAGEAQRNIGLQIDQARLAKLRQIPPPKDKVEKQNRIRKLDGEINLARSKTDAFVKEHNATKGVLPDLAYLQKLNELVLNEFEKVAEKRYLVNGQYPSQASYVEEAFRRLGIALPKPSKPVAPGLAPVNPVGAQLRQQTAQSVGVSVARDPKTGRPIIR